MDDASAQFAPVAAGDGAETPEIAETPQTRTSSAAIDAAAALCFRPRRRADGCWVFELEADATIPAEYILLRRYLGEPRAPELEERIAVYLRRTAGRPRWLAAVIDSGDMDVSATVKAYYALRMIGDPAEAPHMRAAREALLERGGAGACNVFTRILLALFGVISWRAVPEMPVQIILLPRWFPVHLSKISYWARTVIVPLLVLRALKPRARNDGGSEAGRDIPPAAFDRPQPGARRPIRRSRGQAAPGPDRVLARRRPALRAEPRSARAIDAA